MAAADPAGEVGQPVSNFTPPSVSFRDCPPLVGRGGRAVVELLDVGKHAPQLWEAFGADPEGRLWKYLNVGPFEPDAQGRAQFDAVLASLVASYTAHAILVDGKAVGTASYLNDRPSDGVVEVGFIVMAPELQNTTHATEAMFLLMRRAMDEFHYRRYEWKCDSTNLKSNRAAQRFGFTFEGTFRQHMLYKGRNRDTNWYSVVDSEWPAIKAAHEEWLSPTNFDATGTQLKSLSKMTAAVHRARDEQQPRGVL